MRRAATGWAGRWPRRRDAYLYAGALPLAVFLLAWIVYVNFRSDGNPAPLPYVPLLNPLDLAQAGALLALVTWYLGVRRLELPEAKLPASRRSPIKLLGAVLLHRAERRAAAHAAPLRRRAVPSRRACCAPRWCRRRSRLFWSLLALAAMVIATRRGLRALWMVGAVLLGVVVAKLFLVDLANTGTVERIVSFIGVGILVIVVGYFSPVPPKPQEKIS